MISAPKFNFKMKIGFCVKLGGDARPKNPKFRAHTTWYLIDQTKFWYGGSFYKIYRKLAVVAVLGPPRPPSLKVSAYQALQSPIFYVVLVKKSIHTKNQPDHSIHGAKAPEFKIFDSLHRLLINLSKKPLSLFTCFGE